MIEYFYMAFLITFGILSAGFVAFCLLYLFLWYFAGDEKTKKEVKNNG